MEAHPIQDEPRRPADLIARLREVHVAMVDAVLGGEGLGEVAAMAAGAAGAPVALVVPRLGVAVAAPDDPEPPDGLVRYVEGRVADRPAPVPDGLILEEPIRSGDEIVGVVALLGDAGSAEPAPEAAEFLHLAAVAALTEIAIAEAREEVADTVRGSFLESLREGGDLDGEEVVRRAARLGCDLRAGAVALCAELRTDRPRHVVATIAEEAPGALAQHMDGRVYAVLPARDNPQAAQEAARRLAARLQRYGLVGVSSLHADPAELGRAVAEAELVLDVLRHTDGPMPDDIATGTYRLLFRVLASHPEEVRSFYEDTVAPIVRYDEQYRTDLRGTLESYLEHNGNMNATAAAIYAHRHTVAYRLDRVRELTGLDPAASEDRERLGLGLKAYRLVAPRLPR